MSFSLDSLPEDPFFDAVRAEDPAEMNRILTQSDTKVLASDVRNKPTAEAVLQSFDGSLKAIAMDQDAAGDVAQSAMATGSGMEPWAMEMSDLAALYYTGGTTGLPKGVMTSDGAILVQSMNSAKDLHVTEATNYLHAPPLFHMAAAFIAHACMLAGAAQTFLPDMTPETYIETIRKKKVTCNKRDLTEDHFERLDE